MGDTSKVYVVIGIKYDPYGPGEFDLLGVFTEKPDAADYPKASDYDEVQGAWVRVGEWEPIGFDYISPVAGVDVLARKEAHDG